MYEISPIYVSDINFSTLSLSSTELIFDGRHDFLVDRDFGGMAVGIRFSNKREDRGVRRRVELTLIDATLRCPLETRTLQVCMPANGDKEFELKFDCEFTAGHSYKLNVRDVTSPSGLGVFVFHLFDTEAYGHPSKWYRAEKGGLLFKGAEGMHKALADDFYFELRARFIVWHNFEPQEYPVLPELQVRVYHPDGRTVTEVIREPQECGLLSMLYYVEVPFTTFQAGAGTYYAELLCMDYPIAGFPFSVGDKARPGERTEDRLKPLEEYTPEAAAARLRELQGDEDDDAFTADDLDAAIDSFIASQAEEQEEPAVSEPKPEEPLAGLEQLTGLGAVKRKLEVYERVVNFNRLRAENGLPVADAPLHAMFLGSPGTGKTTVAKLMGRMLHKAGLLSRGHVVVRERATLLGRNYSSESENTRAALEEARGGILLIDEAYQLWQPADPCDPGKFVIETLLTQLSDEEDRDWMLILAGYPDEMERMFSLNPGLRSRIPESNIYRFDDFSRGELMEIAENYLERNRFTLTEEARQALDSRLGYDYDGRDRTFGNARHVINLIQTEILPAMAVRVTGAGTPSEAALTEIVAADIPAAVVRAHTARPRLGFAV